MLFVLIFLDVNSYHITNALRRSHTEKTLHSFRILDARNNQVPFALEQS